MVLITLITEVEASFSFNLLRVMTNPVFINANITTIQSEKKKLLMAIKPRFVPNLISEDRIILIILII